MAMNDEVKVWGIWASPFSRRIEMALKFKGIPYEYFAEDLNNKSPMLLQLNPIHKKVPVLSHNGKVIIESHVILEYIEETWPQNPILPQDPYLRSNARIFARLVDEQISNAGFASMVKAGETGRDSLIQQSRDLIKHLEKELAGNDFFGGKSVGFLDFIAASMIPFCLQRYWEGIGIDVTPEDKFPEFTKWVKKMEELEAVKECIPPKKEHIEHMMYMAERIKSA